MSTTKERQEQQQSVNTILDQIKGNARRRTIYEARKDIPSYTQMIDEYQDQTLTLRLVIKRKLQPKKMHIISAQI